MTTVFPDPFEISFNAYLAGRSGWAGKAAYP